ncbi:RagB/SusD family nutrient uptake outer membrane protein [Pedobacter hiemivivus]|uniref:RagB/SusD family nutrient uptake outer membrane protein n=1 Tax=Pedobacter hiemivivus TaxID=2530454 RepID=A0A4U1G1U9_9SPHI|nr:RagB/SusD family nutrient uptake outer membrane protein [Pedobacter hiemivivus]TKC57124.1 RagB/SusD family nutrient uptake outer membrane protein [Pedobacter hiemivivus]
MKSIYIYIKTPLKELLWVLAIVLIAATGCKKYLDIPLPVNKIAGEGAYTNDKSSAATINNILGNFSTQGYFDGSATNNLCFFTGLYTDELQNLNITFANQNLYYTNAINAGNTGGLWSNLYKQIYNANLTIEGVTTSNTLTYKNQWLGEAYFIRAFCFFYLANYYGDVVITSSSDYLMNKDLPRVAKTEAYKLITADLLKAKELLSNEYKDGNGLSTTGRGRPNKFTAAALLARTYLYTEDWSNAEIQANDVITATINGASAYTLLPPSDIDKVFLSASKETIFNLGSTRINQDYVIYNNNMPAIVDYNAGGNWGSVNVAISPMLISVFEKNSTTLADDLRKTYWIRSATMKASTTNPVIPAQIKYFPNKYKSSVVGAENIVLFRLAEQYLIRAEARARRNNLDGAKADLDMIRIRAGLNGTNAVGQTDMINAIIRERRVELFTESSHRFLDLKRTSTIDAVMNLVVTQKGNGATWNPLKQNFPIPVNDILANPKLRQTEGY